MTDSAFQTTRIEQHVVGIGTDVRPPIELALDALRIQEFYNQVSEQFPKLFSDLNQSKTSFQIHKEIPIVGKGKINVPTFTLTPRGPVFNFPITLPGILEDHDWSSTLNEDVIKCLETFHRHLPGTHFFRIGKVRNLVFNCGDAQGREAFRERFCPHAPQGSNELEVSWNHPDDHYNRKITAKAVEKQQLVQRNVGEGVIQQAMVSPGEQGINVTFDVNNRRLDKPLNAEQMLMILKHADDLYKDYLYRVLRGEEL